MFCLLPRLALIASGTLCALPAVSAPVPMNSVERSPAPAPAGVLSRMRRGGVSLDFKRLRLTDRRDIGVHIYVVPTGRADLKPGKITRDDILSGEPLRPSPFYLDVLQRIGQRWSAINRVTFTEESHLNALQIRWLRRGQRSGPVIMLGFGVGDEGVWHLFVFAHGFRLKPTQQDFGFSMSRDSYSDVRFDRVDRSGTMMIVERIDDSGRNRTYHYRWNGRKFGQ